MIPEIKNILYATDLSENSRLAFNYAAILAERFNAKMTVLHVIEDMGANTYLNIGSFVGEEEWSKLKSKREQNLLDDVTQRLTEFCNEVSEDLSACKFILDKILTTRGIAVEEILKRSQENDVDIIVMGTHGYNMFADALMGGTARRVIRRSKIPVMTVRPDEVQSEGS